MFHVKHFLSFSKEVIMFQYCPLCGAKLKMPSDTSYQCDDCRKWHYVDVASTVGVVTAHWECNVHGMTTSSLPTGRQAPTPSPPCREGEEGWGARFCVTTFPSALWGG